jgi:uncharacterized delta-60 repeat protein
MITQFRHFTWKVSLLFSLISLLAFSVALAAPGNQATTFDGDVHPGKPSRPAVVFDGASEVNGQIAAPSVVGRAPGDLDATFDGDGRVTTDVNAAHPFRSDTVFDIAIQSNGKILAAGYNYIPASDIQDFAVTRYSPTNGALDPTFSGDGKLITNFGGADVAYNVAVQSDGKIVVSGEVCGAPFSVGGCDVAVARYNPGGSPDTSFSGDGRVVQDFGGDDNGSIGGLAIDGNGRIVVAGYMWNGADYDFAVYRFLSNGNLDTTFSGDGLLKTNFGAGRPDIATVLAIQPDGKIIVAGHRYNGSNYDFAVARLKPNGVLDTTFSGDGRQTTDFGGDDRLWGFAGMQDGRFVTVGTTTAGISKLAMARYKAGCNPDDCLDTSFNVTGKKVFTISPGIPAFGGDGVIQPDGKILVAGGSGSDFALVRLKPNGAFDTSFNANGKVTVDFGGSDFAWIVRRQTDGKYVLGGYTDDSAQSDFALARVLP